MIIRGMLYRQNCAKRKKDRLSGQPRLPVRNLMNREIRQQNIVRVE